MTSDELKTRRRIFWTAPACGIGLGLLIGFTIGIQVADQGITVIIPLTEGQKA